MTLAVPSTGEAHVHWVELDSEPAQSDTLSEDEQARAARFRFPADASRWITGRSFLRRTLSAYLSTDPSAFRFETGPWGKPGLPGCPLRFNVSHSGSIGLIAFGWRQEVGVDIEQERTDFIPEDLAAQVFSAREQDWLRAVPAAERHQAFLTLWTAKEAYVKAVGSGLSFPASQVTLLPIPESNEFQVHDSRISVCRLHSVPGYRAALAAEGLLPCLHHFGGLDKHLYDLTD